ncbi:MAG: hypothetical protein IPG04_05380 [Polyangiaceae bacterium]|nr:hypothetical protein [Polyangiaceae bacterium]
MSDFEHVRVRRRTPLRRRSTRFFPAARDEQVLLLDDPTRTVIVTSSSSCRRTRARASSEFPLVLASPSGCSLSIFLIGSFAFSSASSASCLADFTIFLGVGVAQVVTYGDHAQVVGDVLGSEVIASVHELVAVRAGDHHPVAHGVEHRGEAEPGLLPSARFFDCSPPRPPLVVNPRTIFLSALRQSFPGPLSFVATAMYANVSAGSFSRQIEVDGLGQKVRVVLIFLAAQLSAHHADQALVVEAHRGRRAGDVVEEVLLPVLHRGGSK